MKTFAAILAVLASLTTALPAQERDSLEGLKASLEAKIHASEKQIAEVLKEARAWAEKGWETRAAELEKKAGEMREKLDAWARQQKKKLAAMLEEGERNERKEAKPDVPMSLEQAVDTLRGLEQGIAALRRLGRMDMADQLEKVAAGMREKISVYKRRQGAVAQAAREHEAKERERERSERQAPEDRVDQHIRELQLRISDLEGQLKKLRASLELDRGERRR
ncbi:MAG: hypothetical protein R3F30_03425 [Planctomycetota bacterium]